MTDEEKRLMDECLQPLPVKQYLRQSILGLPRMLISPNKIETIKLYPQTPNFRASRIVVPSSISVEPFVLWDLRICGKSQLIEKAVPMSLFSETAISVGFEFPICPIGNSIELDIVLDGSYAVCFTVKDDINISHIHYSRLPVELRNLHPNSGKFVSAIDLLYDGSFEIPDFLEVRYSDRHWNPNLEGELVSRSELAKIKNIEPKHFTGALFGTSLEHP